VGWGQREGGWFVESLSVEEEVRGEDSGKAVAISNRCRWSEKFRGRTAGRRLVC